MMTKIEGRYWNEKTGEWSPWMELSPFLRKHTWNGVVFETRFDNDKCEHQWLLVPVAWHNTGTWESQQSTPCQYVAWCPNCNAERAYQL